MQVRFLTLLLALALSPAVLLAQTIEYLVGFQNRVHHEAVITLTVSGLPAGKAQDIRMARSSPGRYALHEFAKNVYSVQAKDGKGKVLTLDRPDPYSWRVAGHDGTIVFTYTLFGDRADGTYAGIQENYAHLNIPATFAYPANLDARPRKVRFLIPEGAEWKVITQLKEEKDGTFSAPHLQYFMDSPVGLGAFTVRSWQMPQKADGSGLVQTIRLAVLHTGTEAEVDSLAAVTKRAVRAQQAVFGELPTFDYGVYTFIANYMPTAAGDGMEHRNSTSLTSSFPLSRNFMGLAGTVSHEFFHCWNVERIRPATLEPFAFDRANMSGELWLAEGFTSYYDDLALRRAGAYSQEEYIEILGQSISFFLASPARNYGGPVYMSRQAPFVDAGVSIDPTNRNSTFYSYYPYGAAVAMALDMSIRTQFPGKSLDDFMQAMWQRHGKPEKPYTLADVQNALAAVTSPAFAADFCGRYIHGSEVPDYAALFQKMGLSFTRTNPERPLLGYSGNQPKDGGLLVSGYTQVGSALYAAGIDKGDILRKLGEVELTNLDQLTLALKDRKPGDKLQLMFVRNGEARQAEVTLTADPSYTLTLNGPASDALKQWIGSGF